MNDELIISKIAEIESCLNDLKALIYSPKEDEIELAIIWDDQLSYIHLWDGRNSVPRMLSAYSSKLSEADIIKLAENAINTLSFSPQSYKSKVIWRSDLDFSKLNENFKKWALGWSFKEESMNYERRVTIKGFPNVKHYLSTESSVSRNDTETV